MRQHQRSHLWRGEIMRVCMCVCMCASVYSYVCVCVMYVSVCMYTCIEILFWYSYHHLSNHLLWLTVCSTESTLRCQIWTRCQRASTVSKALCILWSAHTRRLAFSCQTQVRREWLRLTSSSLLPRRTQQTQYYHDIAALGQCVGGQ